MGVPAMGHVKQVYQYTESVLNALLMLWLKFSIHTHSSLFGVLSFTHNTYIPLPLYLPEDVPSH